MAVEDEEKEAETRALDEPDREMRERVELRSRASLTNFLTAAISGRQVSGAEAELQSGGRDRRRDSLGTVGHTRQPVEQRQTDAATDAPGTVGVNLARIRPQVFANSIAPRLGIEMPRVMSGTYASATITTPLTAVAKAKGAAQDATAAILHSFECDAEANQRPPRPSPLRTWPPWGRRTSNQSYGKTCRWFFPTNWTNRRSTAMEAAPNLAGVFQGLTDPTDPTAVADFDSLRRGPRGRCGRPLGEHDQGREHCLWSYHVQARKPHIPDRHKL